jgi:hypothetical protein
MVFLMRRVVEEADNLEDATQLITSARRTVGVNYILADARVPRGIVLETTRRFVARFVDDDSTEHRVAYARPLPNAVVRADTAMDPTIRDRQLASSGNPSRPGLEPPAGSAYETRYLGQVAGLRAFHGRLTPTAAQEIAQAVAPGSNVQSVIFAWPDLWVANARGLTSAATTPYHHLSAEALFERLADQ